MLNCVLNHLIMKPVLFVLAVLLSGTLIAQNKFSIKGDASKVGEPIEKVFLYYRAGNESITDSMLVKEGKYSFSGTIAEPVMARIRAVYPELSGGKKRAISFKRDYVTVFLEPSAISVNSTDSFSNAVVKGSGAHTEYQAIEEKTKALSQKSEALNKGYTALYNAKDEAGMKELEKKFDEISAERNNIYRAYLKSNPNSALGVFLVNQIAGWDMKSEEIEPLFAALPKKLQEQPSAVELKEKIEIAKKTGIGKYAMEFTQNDTLGNPVKLSSFRGKYLLIDFWASWCGPCRKENPNVVKAYDKFKSKGFHILGVSLDQSNGKDRWIKAIHDDGLVWTHVSDLQYWKNAVAVQYGIQAIPQNLLLDPEGKIVAKNLNGEDLEKKLSELLDK